jgi:3-oxoacyl-[acyl-carrier protein] reductase
MRNVIVTGASRGIGLGLARHLTQAGYRVLAIARRTTAELDEAIHAAPGAIVFKPFDLERIDAIPGLITDLRREHGPIYGLVNNAGIGTEGLLSTMSIADMERIVRLNTLVPLVVAKHALRSMMSAGSGRIVNMSSIVASTGYSGLSVYSATKASMVGFTRSLAREVGPLGITVNAVAPGFVETDMTAGMDDKQHATVVRRAALKRLPGIDDVAHAIVYLLSDGAKNVTGTVLTVDAGSTA